MEIKNKKISKGGCHCGAVKYEVTGELRGVVNCHCSDCTQLNGHFGAHSKALKEDISLIKSDSLKWYSISHKARRSFCDQCGSGLFWELIGDESMGIIAGTLEKPTQLNTIGHIFVSEKSDFYEITDQCPQYDLSSNGELKGDNI